MNQAITALAALAALLALAPSAAAAATPPLFGTTEFRAESLDALPKWQRVLSQIDRERATYQACARGSKTCPSRAAVAWQSVVRTHAGRPSIEQLQAVNRFLNDWRYKADDQNYGRRDYWATPLEFLRRSGDCEDYAAPPIPLRSVLSLNAWSFGDFRASLSSAIPPRIARCLRVGWQIGWQKGSPHAEAPFDQVGLTAA